jgi:hypothetical protein
MIWNVEGADARTGGERLVSVVADSVDEAERLASEQGLLVSAVFPSTIVEATPYDASKVAAAAEPVSAAAPVTPVRTVAYKSLYTKSPAASKPPWSFPWPQWSGAWDAPPYFHLRLASIVLGVLAALAYASGVLSVLFGFFRFVNDFDRSAGFFNALFSFFELSAPLILGALLHAAAAACDALRDIAVTVRFGPEKGPSGPLLGQQERDRESAEQVGGG